MEPMKGERKEATSAAAEPSGPSSSSPSQSDHGAQRDIVTDRPSPPGNVPKWLRDAFATIPARIREWVTDPDFSIYFVVFMVASVALFLRQPSGVGGGFIFDEQEAILANPYVRGHQPWMDAFKRDFWGLLPDRSIGSYRPLPNLLWRGLWRLQEWKTKGAGTSPMNTPFVWFNIVFHATNAALVSSLVRGVLRRVSVAWIAGAIFCACAVLTEAISGIVGIADVLGGLSLLLALAAISLHPSFVAPAVFAATLFGLLSKESAVVNVGLVPLAALLLSRHLDPERPYTLIRTVASLVGAAIALLVYFKIRNKYFHLDLPIDEAMASKGFIHAKLAKLQQYVGAPNLPVDPFNNPLAEPTATDGQRYSGALRVYFRGLGQVLVPHHLSPDYSMPQEPLPKPGQLYTPEAILGGIFMAAPPLAGLWLAWKGWQERSPEHSLLATGLMAWPAAFFPLSNIPRVLPTVRAERFWYTPALGTSIAVAVLFLWVSRRQWYAAAAAAFAFLTWQAVQARRHANHFKDDLAFWKAAAEAVPNSAKAHLNYSVMLGARAVELWKITATQAQEMRLKENIRATELAPRWDMAFIYVGDTLCQLNRMDEAWSWYVKGFRIGPANTGLIALALQCMSDHNSLLGKETEARALITEPGMPGSWLAYLVDDTLRREHKCRGTDEVPAEVELEEETPAPTLTVSSASSASASMSGSASSSSSSGKHASTSASASMSGTASSSASAPKPEAPNRKVLPPCGVDPKYRPRGLDGDPKSE